MQLNLEKERAAVSALEKKQRKFDQVCVILCALWGETLLPLSPTNDLYLTNKELRAGAQREWS